MRKSLFYFHLQDQGVAEHRVGEVIRMVMNTLGRRSVESLPSTSTQARFASEIKAISREQVREEVKGKTGITLKYDRTTKGRLGHLAEVEVATKDNTFLMGVQQQPGGTSKDYVKSIKSVCSHVDDHLMANVTNTMTNTAVDRELQEESGHTLNSFRCAMHPLDSFAREANTILKKEDEKRPVIKGSMPYQNRGECSAQSVLRAADKLFNNAASGDNVALKTYLADKGLPSSLPRWVGNRFNILFSNACILFCSGDGILEYFTKVARPQNSLQQAFINAWSNTPRTALRCLGLLFKCFLEPWKAMVGRDIPILEMNALFEEARSTLQRWENEPLEIVHGRTVFGKVVTQDSCWALLTKMADSEQEQVGYLLSKLIGGIIGVMNRQLSTQLPGGELYICTY